ncbi:MAG: 50S ribosomal protein L32 [Bacteroidales bacterium]
MAHPKSKISKTRRDKRRTHYKATEPSITACSNCGSYKLTHRVCPECGYYRNQVAIEKSTTA